MGGNDITMTTLRLAEGASLAVLGCDCGPGRSDQREDVRASDAQRTVDVHGTSSRVALVRARVRAALLLMLRSEATASLVAMARTSAHSGAHNSAAPARHHDGAMPSDTHGFFLTPGMKAPARAAHASITGGGPADSVLETDQDLAAPAAAHADGGASAGDIAPDVKPESSDVAHAPTASPAVDEQLVAELLQDAGNAFVAADEPSLPTPAPEMLIVPTFGTLELPAELFVAPGFSALTHDADGADDAGVINLPDYVTMLPVQPRGNPVDGPGTDAEAVAAIPRRRRARMRLRLSGIILLGVVLPTAVTFVMYLAAR